MNNEEKILELLTRMDKRLDKLEPGQAESRRIEALETDVAILKLAFRTLSEELQALKKAQ